MWQTRYVRAFYGIREDPFLRNDNDMDDLTPRLAEILTAVIEYHVATGKPVGSRYICQQGDFSLAPSTVRSELARLEALGYLDHPHTSAGRVPTDRGYRFFVDNSFRERRTTEITLADDARVPDVEIEEALSHAASLLARATGLLALISAPSQDNSAIKHVEVLQLHPDIVVIVVITASGGIAKRLAVFDAPVDPGLVSWARGYLNEAVCGLDLGSRRLMLKLAESGLTSVERSFVEAVSKVFTESPDGGGGLYIEGTSRFFSRLEVGGGDSVGRLMEMLDRQDEIMDMLKSALSEHNVYLRIGREIPSAAMSGCSLVAANYGLAHRNLGTVGVLGPTRMDYHMVIGNVAGTARSLSRLVEEIYN